MTNFTRSSCNIAPVSVVEQKYVMQSPLFILVMKVATTKLYQFPLRFITIRNFQVTPQS